MPDRRIVIPPGYEESSQWVLGQFAAQMDDQWRRLRDGLGKLHVSQLEWQWRRGMNTVGMLLAHMAIAEVYWMNVAVAGMAGTQSGEDATKDILGIGLDDDGMPLATDGRHPAALEGKAFEFYVGLIDAARAATHKVLQSWTDADLELTYPLRDFQVSRHWTVYHALEHFCGHAGQILMLKHMMMEE